MPLPTLSVLIPTCNGLEHLKRLLPSVCRFAPPDTQVLVIDDGSTDETSSWIRSAYPGVELWRTDTNLGFCGAVNTGLVRARGDVVELLNDDTEVTAGWAEAALRHFADPLVGSVAPLAVTMERPDIIDSAGQDYHVCGWARDRHHGHAIDAGDRAAREVFGASASCGFYRRDALEKVGGLWTYFGAYIDDTDLAFRLRWAGYRSIHEPRSRVAHKGSASYGRHSGRQVYLVSRNEEIVYWANLPLGALLLGLLPHFGFLLVRLLRKLLGGGAWPFCAGKIDALRAWRTILQRRSGLPRLIPTDGQRIDLAVSAGADVMWQGIDWLRFRRCS